MSAVLPDGAILLAKDDQGRLYQFGDQLVIERSFNGKRIETRLPVNDLDWLWRWSDMLNDAVLVLAHHQLR